MYRWGLKDVFPFRFNRRTSKGPECFGSNAHVWLFGSRVDDKARGGDIDLYVELTEPLADATWYALRFSGALQQAFGAQRTDVITRGP